MSNLHPSSPSNSGSKRLFIAAPVSPEVKEILAEKRSLLQRILPFRKWVHPEDHHITLQYLGQVPPEIIESIRSGLTDIASRTKPLTLTAHRIGSFGRPQAPKILWLGVQGELEPLRLLQKQITDAMDPLGYPAEDRPYSPHITLARQYTGAERPDLKAAEEALQGEKASKQVDSLQEKAFRPEDAENTKVLDEPDPFTWRVQEIIVYESLTNRKGGPVYEPMMRFAFPASD